MVVKQTDLLAALKAVGKIPVKDATSIWSNVVLRPIGTDRAELRAMSYESEVIVRFPAECDESDTEMAFLHQTAEKVIKTGDGSAWWIGMHEGRAAFLQHLFAWHAPKVNIESLPARMAPENMSPMAAVGTASFLDAIKRVSAAMSYDIGRPNINGVNVDRDESGALRMTATDGHILLTATCEAAIGPEFKPFTIMRAAIVDLIRAGDESDLPEVLPIFGNGRMIQIKTTEATMTLRCMDYDYPAWRNCIPHDFKTIISADRKAFVAGMTACKRAYQSHGTSIPLAIINANSSVKLRTICPVKGTFDSVLDGATKIDSSMPDVVDLAFNSNLLIQTAKMFGSRRVQWFLPPGPVYGALMTEEGIEPLVGLTALVMPTRL